ncbi:MAG TPA: hypothetical protein VMG12_42810 [Polyangiaceae bacterium]|nr:hypothetical protein [Polyangiaceae bacterium]
MPSAAPPAKAPPALELATAVERGLRLEREVRASPARRVAADLDMARELAAKLDPPIESTLPWLSPSEAQRAIRAVNLPLLPHGASYPAGTRVIARGNVRPARDLSNNLISNGDFSHGDTMWSVRNWQGYGAASIAAYYAVRAGALCTSLERNQQVLGGWPWDDRRLSPSSFELERGKRYRLSLRAWSSGPESVDLVVKVGHQKEPYTPALVAQVPVRSEPELFDIDFVAERRDNLAGLTFIAGGPEHSPQSELCIDDVSLRTLDAR